jgi:gamma-glutamylputrescine oxidase
MRDPLANSFYAASSNPWSPQPALKGNHRCDVVIIGGGFTGVSAALACAEKGLSVILLEAETIGFGASGRNGGQLIPGLRWTMSEIEGAFGQERAQAIFDLCWQSPSRVEARIAQHGINCDLTPGHLEAAWTPADFDAMLREADFLATRYGYETQAIRKADMGNHIASPLYHGGIYDPHGGHFHPLNYTIGLANAALAAGVQIFEHSPATSVTNHPGGVQIRSGESVITATHALLATDAWMQDVAPALGRNTVPIMNYNIATAPLPDAASLLPSNAAVADSRFVLNYFRLSADGRMLFGGGEKYVQTPPADIGGFVRKHMAEVFPTLADAQIEYAWGGAVAVTMNRLPDIGRNGNIFHAHGFSGHGALVTTLAGELVAEAIIGTMERFDVLASLPIRPFPGGAWLRRPLATLGLLWYALRDRL